MGIRRRWTALNNKRYWQRVYATAPTNLIAYWPLNESGGATATDRSAQGNHASYSGVALDSSTFTNGDRVGLWDGSADFVNIHSTGFAADFNPASGTAALWLRVAAAGVWTDGTVRYLLQIRADVNNRVALLKESASNDVVWAHVAGGTNRTNTKADASNAGWVHMALTWSASVVQPYWAGLPFGDPLAGVGSWSGALSSTQTLVGAFNSSPVQSGWSGNIAHVAIWNTPLTAAQIASLARV